MSKNWRMACGGGVLALCCVAVMLGADAPGGGTGLTPRPEGILSYTMPSEGHELWLSFSQPGLIKEVLVKEGDAVKAGQVVALVDDEVEQAALAADKEKAEDVTQIGAETTIREQKKAEALMYAAAFAKNGASSFELENAQLEEKVADARIALAQSEHKQNQLKYLQSLAALKRTKVVCPLDGVVVQVVLHAGEVADGQNMKLMRIVQKDPLWADVWVPWVQAHALNKGDAATVRFSDGSVRPGTVLRRMDIGDQRSNKIVVRVEVANPQPNQLDPGEQVFVTFGSPGMAAGK